MKAMILAAGLGTRLKPFTENHPKALFPVIGITLLERNINYLKKAGIHDIVINVHHFAAQIIDFLKRHDNFNVNISISDESEALLETGGGLLKAAPYLKDDTFVLLNVDILTHLDLKEMMAQHQKNQTLATLAVSKRDSSRQLGFTDEWQLCAWKNLKTGELVTNGRKAHYERAFSGIHIIEPTIFDLISETGKFSIIKTYLRLMHTHSIKGFDHTGIPVLDVGKPENINIAESLFI